MDGIMSGKDFGIRTFDFTRDGDQDGQRTLTKVKCSECGKECEVPFKPIKGRPVFCRECYAKKRPKNY